MKLSSFIPVVSFSSFFALMWLCIMSSDWQPARIVSLVIFFVFGLLSAATGYTPKPKV